MSRGIYKYFLLQRKHLGNDNPPRGIAYKVGKKNPRKEAHDYRQLYIIRFRFDPGNDYGRKGVVSVERALSF